MQAICGFCKKPASLTLVTNQSITNATYKNHLVACSHCGAVVGVLPYTDAGQAVHIAEKNLTDRLSVLQSGVNNVFDGLTQIAHQIAKLNR